MVSQAWKALSAEEKEPWEQLAREDRARYDREKAEYNGPWKTVAPTTTGIKRPISAFVTYSNERRRKVTRDNPDLTAAQISGRIGQMWKQETPQVRQHYLDQYAASMQEFRRQHQGPCNNDSNNDTEQTSLGGTVPTQPRIKQPALSCANQRAIDTTQHGDETCSQPISRIELEYAHEMIDEGSNESNETFGQIDEQALLIDPWETFKQTIIASPNISLTDAIVERNFVPLTTTDTECFLTVAALLFEPLDNYE